jgi:hypothetical protein
VYFTSRNVLVAGFALGWICGVLGSPIIIHKFLQTGRVEMLGFLGPGDEGIQTRRLTLRIQDAEVWTSPQITKDGESGVKMGLSRSVLIRGETGIDDGEIRTGGYLEPIERTDERLITFLEKIWKNVVSREGVDRITGAEGGDFGVDGILIETKLFEEVRHISFLRKMNAQVVVVIARPIEKDTQVLFHGSQEIDAKERRQTSFKILFHKISFRVVNEIVNVISHVQWRTVGDGVADEGSKGVQAMAKVEGVEGLGHFFVPMFG